MAIRPSIKSGDVILGEIGAVCPADGWVAVYSTNESKPVISWVLMRTGELVGLVGGEPQGTVIDSDLRAADKALNFSNYRRVS